MKKNSQIKIFMDETGKDDKRPSMFGGISIPIDCYEREEIHLLNDRLQKQELKYHFADYRKRHLDKYKDLINAFSNISPFMTMNAIAWKKSALSTNQLISGEIFTSDNYKEMVYSKIPERVVYGLLRNHSTLTTLRADIFIEDSSEYESRQLNQTVKSQVNAHALYRSDLFKIQHSKLTSKNKQIGLEFTDMVIGMSVFIMENVSVNIDEMNHRKKEKAELILFALDRLDDLFLNMNLFELSSQEKLEKIDFNNYVRLFRSKFVNLETKHVCVPKGSKRKYTKVS